MQRENTEIKAFIREHSALFWYTPEDKKEEVSDALLVETILNYGTMEEVKELFRIMGIQEVSRVFFAADGRKKLNYYPEIYHYFTLIFNRYAPRDSNCYSKATPSLSGTLQKGVLSGWGNDYRITNGSPQIGRF